MADKKLYIGYTNDLKRRLKEHNKGENMSTRARLPLELVYYEAYLSKKDAKLREAASKKFSGATLHLRRRIKNSILSK